MELRYLCFGSKIGSYRPLAYGVKMGVMRYAQDDRNRK